MKQPIEIAYVGIATRYLLTALSCFVTSQGIVDRLLRYSAIIAGIILLATSCKSKNETTSNSDTYYTCSMDPQVIEYKPGKCPICRMELTPVKKK